MDTIFLSLAKKYILEGLEHIISATEQADKGVGNWIGTFFGSGRDPVLADDKRSLVKTLHANIMNIEPKNSDEQNYKALDLLLKQTISAVEITEKAAKEKKAAAKKTGTTPDKTVVGATRGITSPGLEEVKNCLLGIHNKFEELEKESKCKLEAKQQIANDTAKKNNKEPKKNTEAPLKLLDIDASDDPHNIYIYHMANYFVLNVLISRKATVFKSALGYMTNMDISLEKENEVMSSLCVCATELKYLSTRYDTFEVRKQKVSNCLNALKRGNRDLCDDNSFGINGTYQVAIAASVTVKVPTIAGPAEGHLLDCLKEAETRISKTTDPLEIAVERTASFI